MSAKTYSPKKVIAIIGGNVMGGFADGTFIVAERDADSFTKHVGADGETGRVQSANRAGRITLTLAQYSPSNDVLSGLVLADELSGNGIVPVILKDSSGSTVIFSGEGWVMKPADAEFSNDVSDREWVIDMASVDFFVGGNS